MHPLHHVPVVVPEGGEAADETPQVVGWRPDEDGVYHMVPQRARADFMLAPPATGPCTLTSRPSRTHAPLEGRWDTAWRLYFRGLPVAPQGDKVGQVGHRVAAGFRLSPFTFAAGGQRGQADRADFVGGGCPPFPARGGHSGDAASRAAIDVPPVPPCPPRRDELCDRRASVIAVREPRDADVAACRP
jgi:hypothetical protein